MKILTFILLILFVLSGCVFNNNAVNSAIFYTITTAALEESQNPYRDSRIILSWIEKYEDFISKENDTDTLFYPLENLLAKHESFPGQYRAFAPLIKEVLNPYLEDIDSGKIEKAKKTLAPLIEGVKMAVQYKINSK